MCTTIAGKAAFLPASLCIHSVLSKGDKMDPEAFGIQLWNLRYDGDCLGLTTSEKPPFDGEMGIQDLDTFPCEFLRKDPEGKNFKPHRKRLKSVGRCTSD